MFNTFFQVGEKICRGDQAPSYGPVCNASSQFYVAIWILTRNSSLCPVLVTGP